MACYAVGNFLDCDAWSVSVSCVFLKMLFKKTFFSAALLASEDVALQREIYTDGGGGRGYFQ